MCKSDGHLQRRSLKLRVTDLADVCDEMWGEHHSEPIRCCLWLGVWFWLERLRCCRWICESEGPWCPPHHWTSASRTDPSTRSDTAWREREERVSYFEQKEEALEMVSLTSASSVFSNSSSCRRKPRLGPAHGRAALTAARDSTQPRPVTVMM